MSEVSETGPSGVVTPAPDSNLQGRLPRGSRARTLDAGVRRHDEKTHYRCLLKGYIEQFIAVNNNAPKPFVWKASVEKILAKINRCKVILETVH